MNGALIVGAAPAAGRETFYRALLAEAGFVIAADAAGEWCASLGRVPDVVVGDFDSSRPGAAERLREAGARVVTLDVRKDVSDLDACVDEARALARTPLTFAAAFEGRPDHTLAAFGAVCRASAGGRAVVREPSWTAYALEGGDDALVLDLAPGTTFSVIAPAGARGVSLSGGSWPLDSVALEPLSSLGLSNVAISNVVVEVEDGVVLVIVPVSS